MPSLRALMQGPLPVTAPLVLNPLMAKMVEAAGFPAGRPPPWRRVSEGRRQRGFDSPTGFVREVSLEAPSPFRFFEGFVRLRTSYP
jgi:hypothetical protein